MSCTRMGRIRKLIKKIKAHGPTYEASQRNQSQMVTLKKGGTVVIVVHTYGRTERREKQLKDLEEISKNGFKNKKGGPGSKKKIKAPKEGTGKRKKK
jgi:hypothetical protein